MAGLDEKLTMEKLNYISGKSGGSHAESPISCNFSPSAGHAKAEKPLDGSPPVAAGGWLPVTALHSTSSTPPPAPPPLSSRHSVRSRRTPRDLSFPASTLHWASEVARRCRMESSSGEELEEEFPGHEWITPQSSINAAYQSQTEKVGFFLIWLCSSALLLHSGQRIVGNFTPCAQRVLASLVSVNLCGAAPLVREISRFWI